VVVLPVVFPAGFAVVFIEDLGAGLAVAGEDSEVGTDVGADAEGDS